MPTFLESHFKIQQLESYLTKNEYLSDECLPNYIDAEVFKALKTSQSIIVFHKEEIPKREIYPNLYHWYVLMRQFSDRTLEIWLKERSMESKKSNIIREVVGVINENKRNTKHTSKNNPQKIISVPRPVSNSPSQFEIHVTPISSSQHVSSRELLESPRHHIDLPKVSSHIVKKPNNQYDTINQYIMDVKLNGESGIDCVRKLFEIETQFICQQHSVKLESIKTIGTNQDKAKCCEIRVFFLTVSHICEDLKNKILACTCVQSIQCKKSKRNQSL